MDLRELSVTELPPLLQEIPDVPKKLWLRGVLPEADTKYLAVVGSRAFTKYGRESCEFLIAGLAGYPISIISGLALGIDSIAHRSALMSGLHTVAIPGSGLNDRVIYPRANVRLAKNILKAGGALLSEHPPDYRARPYDFPLRNRLMVGMADAVLVIEAGPRSGTLITARLAGEYNRHLLCVPHRIGDNHAFGGHSFIRNGATLVSEPAHLLEALQIPLPEENEHQPLPPLTPIEEKIYQLLEESLPRDELIRASNLPPNIALMTLISLELKGVAHEKFGVWKRR